MQQSVLTDLSKNTILLTLLNSDIPQSLIIKNIVVPKRIKHIVVDTVVRNKLTDMRFMKLKAIDGKTDWSSREYFIPDKQIVIKANKVLTENSDSLTKSFLTEREINIIKREV